MNPTTIFGDMKSSQSDFDISKVSGYKRLDSGSIEMDLRSGAHGVYRIDPRSKKRYLILEWTDAQARANATKKKEEVADEQML